MRRKAAVRSSTLAAAAALVAALVATPAAGGEPTPTPSVSVTSVEISPTPGGDRQDSSHDVIQTISWRDLPSDAALQFRAAGELGLVGIENGVEYQCTLPAPDGFKECHTPYRPASGELRIRYRPSAIGDAYARCACQYTGRTDVRVPSLGLRASGTVRVVGKADVTLKVESNTEIGTVRVVVGNNGPTHAPPSTLTITGFADPVETAPGSGCTSAGLTVTCETPMVRVGETAPMLLTISGKRVRLTVTLTGYFPDPDTSAASNTGVAFPDAPAAGPATATPATTAAPTSAPAGGPRSSSPSTSASTSPSTSGQPQLSSSPTPVQSLSEAGPSPAQVALAPRAGARPHWLAIGGVAAVVLLVTGMATMLLVRARRPGPTPER